MKISYISRSNTWNDRQIIKEAEKLSIDLEKIDNLKDLNNSEIYDSLGDVVLWRSSLLEPRSGRTTLLNILDKSEKIIINRSLIDYPAVIFKQFQQEYLRQNTKDILTIPTFTFQNKKDLVNGVKEGLLKFPFIKKPNLGAKGEGIKLIEDNGEIDLLTDEEVYKSVFQNFIKNDGDYRVLVVGGKPIGAIKRVGEKGSFVNNVSMGGEALAVTDGSLKIEMFKIASQVAGIFNLGFCGVDIIQDTESQKLYFLELNTVPQWEGFQKCTGINVAEKLLGYCQDLAKRKSQSAKTLVKKYYLGDLENLANRKFHFLTRMFLWTRDEKYLEELKYLKKDYFGRSENDFRKIIKKIFADKDIYQKRIYNKKDFRVKSANKYPLLGVYSELLFRNLMSKNIFGENLYPILKEFMPDEELLQIRTGLLESKKDVLNLSTFAINYLYFLEEYFPDNQTVQINIKQLLQLTEEKDFGSQQKKSAELMNNVYFLTHIIIGASRFYRNKINRDREDYLQVLKILEKIVEQNYIKLSLDTKLELLVCAKLLNTESSLRTRIEQEAALSLSPIGNFLIDTMNAKREKSPRGWLGSEHRNVLYIMLNSK